MTRYRTCVRELHRKKPWPSGPEITVYDVPRDRRAEMLGEIFKKVPNAVKIIFK